MPPPDSIAPQAGHQTVTIALLFAAYLGGFGIFIQFFPVWLDWLGLGSGWIAVLVAMPLIMRVATTSLVADRAEGYADPRGPLRWLSLASFLLFALLPAGWLLPELRPLIANPWLLLVLVAVMAVGWNALLPLTDAVAIQVSRATGTAYGRMRVWGSIAFIATSFGAGLMVERAGLSSVPWMIAALFGAFYLVSLALPQALAGGDAARTAGPRRSGWVFFFRRRGAVSVFLGAALMQGGHAVLYGFGSLSWAAQGFPETTIGLLWSLGVLCEIALFFASRPIIDRIGARGLLIVGGIGALLRWTVLAFLPPLEITVLLQVLHAFSFGMTHLALISYIARRARPGELRAAQGVYAVVSGAIMALATLAAGPLYAAFGSLAYLAMAGMTLAGLAIVIVNRLTVPGGAVRR